MLKLKKKEVQLSYHPRRRLSKTSVSLESCHLKPKIKEKQDINTITLTRLYSGIERTFITIFIDYILEKITM